MRVRFQRGGQRKFLRNVLKNINCPSLRAFLQFGFDVPYSTLKNYYSEKRCLPENFFNELCTFGKINKKNINFSLVEENWGKVKGGKKRRKNI